MYIITFPSFLLRHIVIKKNFHSSLSESKRKILIINTSPIYSPTSNHPRIPPSKSKLLTNLNNSIAFFNHPRFPGRLFSGKPKGSPLIPLHRQGTRRVHTLPPPPLVLQHQSTQQVILSLDPLDGAIDVENAPF